MELHILLFNGILYTLFGYSFGQFSSNGVVFPAYKPFCVQFYEPDQSSNKIPLQLKLKENVLPGTTVKQFVKPSVKAQARIVSGARNFFDFDPVELILKTSRRLNSRRGERLFLNVTCTEVVHPYNIKLSFDTAIVIVVEDINDPPVFVNLPATVSTPEAVPSQRIIYKAVADDPFDVDEQFRRKYYRLLNVSSVGIDHRATEKFRVDRQGNVIVLGGLDYDHGPREYNLVIETEDEGYPPLKNQSVLTVLLEDSDDQGPRFSRRFYNVTVIGEKPILEVECHVTVPPMLAVDQDPVQKSPINYRIASGKPGEYRYWSTYFNLESDSGRLCQTETIPRAGTTAGRGFHNFTFTIQSYQTDDHQKTATAELHVVVQDRNVHAPQFRRLLYRTSVPEYPVLRRGMPVVTVEATDDDYGLNQLLKYELVDNPNNAFSVHGTTGMVWINRPEYINREHNDTITVWVKAVESHSLERLESTEPARIEISVLDVNDNPPKFSQLKYEYYVKDNHPVGISINNDSNRIVTTDLDLKENGTVTYQISHISNSWGRFSIKDLNRFVVDASGNIRIGRSLRDLRRNRDFPHYTLHIKAEDQAISSRDRLSSTATVVVHVREANDFPPNFIRLPPPLLIGESSPVGTAVADMKALDKDGDEDIYLQYALVDGNDDRAFAISQRANIVTARPLDREQTAVYRLVVQVSDGIHTINATVVVHLQDENDHAPSFLKVRYDLEMPENVNTGFHIGDVIAKDPDDGRNGMIRYSIAGGDMPHIFMIKQNGSLYVARRDIAIDREIRDAFVITISASDVGNPPKQNSTQVAIHLADVNDNAPQLRRTTYRASVEEGFNAKRLKMLGVVRASDNDKTVENKNVRFSLSGIGSDTFGIHEISGRVRVKKPEDIDCEKLCAYHLKIVARDRLGTGLTSSSDFLVKVLDVNDNKPYFPQNYSIRVGPLTKKGTKVVKLKAIDKDESVQNHRLIYLLKDGGYGKFHVDFASGDLIVVGDLLREPVLFEYLLDVEVYDTGEPRLSGVTTVKITVPISKPPQMPQSFQFSIREDLPIGASAGLLEAFDPDIGTGSQEKLYFFSINQRVPFSVDNDNGRIRVVDKLDMEETYRYTFEAYVKDNGLPASTATTTVTVMLVDVNDNPPVFSSKLYKGQITEDDQNPAEQTVEVTPPISATDKDVEEAHGNIVFRVEGQGSELFAIDPQTGTIQVANKGSIDCERQCQYNIQMIATDMNGKGLSTNVSLNISVRDVNDNQPQFIGETHFKAGRLAPLGSTVGTVRTTDADVATKNNRVLHFLRSGGLGKFSVDVESGDITIADYLTREPMQEVYTLLIEAHDTGEPKQFSSTTVNITVTLNTSPVMENEVEFEVLEHVHYGTPIGQLEAIDPDNKAGTDKPHQDLEFFLKDISLPFEVDADKGILTTAGHIDRESSEKYSFLVYVKDNGVPPFTATTTVTVHIGDINDNPPVFNSPFGYKATVIEDNTNPLKRQVVLVVPPISTSDADVTTQNRQIWYGLNGDGRELFRIDRWNGTITVREPGSIDCEHRCEYLLEITAVDKNGKGFETKTRLNITVLDQNDNAPIFEDELFFRSNRLSPGGTEIGKIKSFDRDVKSANNRVSFHLERGGFGKFSVNISTGIITVSDSLLREPMMPRYELLVMAMDSGTPSLSVEALVTIEVPLNHRPVLESLSHFTVKENVPVGTIVGNITASDDDLNSNSSEKLKFVLNEAEVFQIDEETGTIRTVADIDRELTDSYQLEVTVEDNGIPQFTATTTVTISLQDENDNKPLFSLSEYHGKVTEADSNGVQDRTVQLNAPVSAMDKDATVENQLIVYSIEGPGSEAFEMDTESAMIQVKPEMTIDCERQCEFNIMVIATDRAGNGSSSESNLSIVVEDINDRAPVFDENVEFQTGRLTSPGTIVGKIHAADQDFTSRNNRVIYLLREGGFGKFAVDVDTGEVIVSDNLTRPPMKEVYELIVEAFDNGSPQLSTVAEVRIHVTLNTPPRVQKYVNVLLEENLSTHSLVTLIRAEDPDIGVNPDEHLSFVMNDSTVPFFVDEIDGKIFLNSSVDREADDTFTFTVYVTDHGVPAYTAESLVTVLVKDLNDNPPLFGSLAGYNGTAVEDDLHPLPRQEVKVTPTLLATDLDATKPNRMVRYSLKGNGSELFEINPHTAEIHVRRAGSLDCERKCEYNLTIIAADQNGTGLRTESKLFLQIRDVNDNIPTIVEKHIFTTGRGAALGTSLGRLQAKDNDTTLENSRILFYLKKGGFQKFAVDFYTGEVITASDLTRDPMLSEYKLVVELYDTGEPQLSSSTELLIKVPKNNPPYTDSHVSLELKENQPAGDVVGKILAEDADIGKVPGEKLQYSIASDVSVPFAINASTGEIISLVSHDKEAVDDYVFGVRVSDNGLPSYTATATLTVLVIDENDNYPVFQSEEYRGVVIEDDDIPIQNQRVTVMPPLAVEDKDRTAENRDVRYRLEGDGSHLFVIDKISGEIKVKDDGTIDCEAWPEFDLQVIASDRGGAGFNTTRSLLIKVEDLNDNSPQLEPEYRLAVGRLTPVGFVIGQIKAIDRDFSAKNNRVHYSLTGGDGSGRFTVDFNTGNMTVTSPLTTLPMKNQYSFSLEAYDTGNPPRSTVTKVYVDVPLNTPPRVTYSFYMSVFENNPEGTVVGNITAFDPDVNAASKERLLFTFNESVPFSVNKADGTIKTTRVLDREVEDRFVFPLLVQDNGAPPFTVTTTVTINVWDQNDNYPVFDAPRGYSAWVTENDDRPSNHSQVEVHPIILAHDGDQTAMNKLIQYSLSGPGSHLFRIDRLSGNIDLSGEDPINCEDMCRFNLTVSATDRNGTGLQTVTNLTVFVEDVNDNPPIFVQDYEFRLHRSSPVGISIGTVKALDQDATEKNKRVMYHITRGSQGDFEIDLMSGDIRVAASLLREPHTENYLLHLEAIDSGTPQLSATTKVKIYVPRNHAPLLQPNFHFEIPENEPEETRVGLIYAEDEDVGVSDAQNLFYWVEEKVPFTIRNQSGEIYTLRELDKEWEMDYIFSVFVKDDGVPPFTASTTVKIDIVDLNDNAPKFRSERGYKARIIEDNILSVGIQELELLPALVVTDEDNTKVNRDIKFTLGGKGAGNFKIDPISGEIHAKYRQIDCESQCRYILDLIATDQGGKGNSTVTKILVEVVDVNDNPPLIPSVYTFTTPRLSAVGTEVGKLDAVDGDWTKKNNRLLYYLKDGGLGKFAVNITSGWVKVNTPLITTPMKEEYVLHVEVYDTGEPQLWALTEVIINVPLNKPPSLPKETNFITEENRDMGDIIGQLSATDPDLVFNPSEQLSYYLNDTKLPFSVEKQSGLVRAAGTIDFEEDDHFQFVVSVSDNGVPPFTASTTVHVQILDVNDHYPRFNSISGYMASIDEDNHDPRPHTRIPVSPRIMVTDGDETPENREVRFYLEGEGSEMFNMDHVTAELSLRKPGTIDCETKCKFHLQIIAADQLGHGLESTDTLSIYVGDVNDHKPVFSSDYRFSIARSSSIGSSVGIIQATDGDATKRNGRILYSIRSASKGDFIINIQTGEIVVANSLFDEPQKEVYTFTVEATDTGDPPLSSKVGVTIHVPMNHPPSIERDMIFTAEETVEIGGLVGEVICTDVDITQHPDQTLTYFMVNTTIPFRINTTNGVITTTGNLDSETIDSYRFPVYVRDNGIPEHTVSTMVTVFVQDVNDNAPVFGSNRGYRGLVAETTLLQDDEVIVIPPISATDLDTSSNKKAITFSLEGVGHETFYIDPHTADVSVRQSREIDCETMCKYYLQIIADDGRGLNSSSNLTITVQDVNDEAPKFQIPENYVVKSTTEVGAVVGDLKAVDHDISRQNNRVMYFLKDGGYGKFAVDVDSGDIMIADSLIREPMMEDYNLEVEAYDTGEPRLSASTIVKIFVDMNHPPEMELFYVFDVRETVPIGTTISQISATDPDKGQTIEYLLGENNGVPFAISKSTGIIKTTGYLDREQDEEHIFVVVAKDNGNPPYTTSTIITVILEDVNDNSPVFASGYHYHGLIIEDNFNPKRGQIVRMDKNVSVFDRDVTEENREVVLSLSGSQADLFVLDPKDGTIRTASEGSIDRESQEAFNLKIVATDQNGRGLSKKADLVISIVDENDHAPVFEKPLFTFNLNHLATAGYEVGHVKAYDPDATKPNNDLLFMLEDDPFGKFRLDVRTGKLYLLESFFSKPRKDEYLIKVSVTDMGFPARKAITKVVVKSSGMSFNDFPPEFLGRTIFYLAEERPVGTLVGRLNIIDKDKNNGSKLNIAIDPGSARRVPFTVDNDGNIRTTAKIDRDKGYYYFLFNVRATDTGTPPLNTSQEIGIIMEDINDNPPEFNLKVYKHMVYDLFPPNTVVATPYAHDGLDLNPSVYRYKMAGGKPGYFYIDTESGEVKTTRNIERLSKETLTYTVTATDLYNRALTATATLQIEVVDSFTNATCCCLVHC